MAIHCDGYEGSDYGEEEEGCEEDGASGFA